MQSLLSASSRVPAAQDRLAPDGPKRYFLTEVADGTTTNEPT